MATVRIVQKASYVIGVALASILLLSGAGSYAGTGFPEVDEPQQQEIKKFIQRQEEAGQVESSPHKQEPDPAKMKMSDWDKRRPDWVKNPPSSEDCDKISRLEGASDALKMDCRSAWVDSMKKETGLSEEELTKGANDAGDTPCGKGIYCKKGQAGEATDGSETGQSEIEELEENNRRARVSDDPLTDKVPDGASAKELYDNANLQSPPPQDYVPINQQFDDGLEGMPAEAGSSSKDLMKVYNDEQQQKREVEQEWRNEWNEDRRRDMEKYREQAENAEEAQRRREQYETAERQQQEMQAQQQQQQHQRRSDGSARAFSNFMSGFVQGFAGTYVPGNYGASNSSTGGSGGCQRALAQIQHYRSQLNQLNMSTNYGRQMKPVLQKGIRKNSQWYDDNCR